MKTNSNFFKILNQIKLDLNKNKYYKASDIIACIKILKNREKFFNRKFFKNKNKKLNANVFSFDIPSGISCNGICHGCYALKNERIMPAVRISRLLNYICVNYALIDNNFIKTLLQKLQSELDYIKLIYNKPVIRLHTSGDMFSMAYFCMWLRLIEKNKDINFYTYTKSAWLLPCVDKIKFKYNNFNIIKSIIKIDDNNYINYGDANYIDTIVNKCKEKGMSCYVCDYNKNNERHAHSCMRDCTKCLHCSNILFYKH